MNEISKYIIKKHYFKNNQLDKDFIDLCETIINQSLREENLYTCVPKDILKNSINEKSLKKDLKIYLTIFYAKTIQATISAILFPIMDINYKTNSSKYADCYDFIRLYAIEYYERNIKKGN